MSAVAAIDAVQARITAIELQLAMRRQAAAGAGSPAAVAGSGASGVPGVSSSALGVTSVADASASLAASATSGTGSTATAIADALGLNDPTTTDLLSGATGTSGDLSSLGLDTSSLLGTGPTGTSGLAGTATTTGTSFDQVFDTAVQHLRAQWAAAGLGSGAVATSAYATSAYATSAYATPAVAGATTATAGTVRGVSVAGSVSSATPYASLFEEAGARYGIPPKVLAAIGWVESRYRTDAVSSAGAVGMMQFLPGTAASMGVDPYDPASAIDGTARYLRSALDRFGDLGEAIAAYNVGPGAIANAGGVQPGTQAERYLTKVVEATARV
ncbi:MAG: transglycosylase SLT domain-containing protein [Acidimicrobiales bacterium]